MWTSFFMPQLLLYNDLIILRWLVSKMNNYISLPANDVPHFRFIIKKSLYKRFYTKTPNSAIFDVENGHHT